MLWWVRANAITYDTERLETFYRLIILLIIKCPYARTAELCVCVFISICSLILQSIYLFLIIIN